MVGDEHTIHGYLQKTTNKDQSTRTEEASRIDVRSEAMKHFSRVEVGLMPTHNNQHRYERVDAGWDREYSTSYNSGKPLVWGTSPDEFAKKVARRLAKPRHPKGRVRILDLGCGEGRHCEYLASRAHQAVGVDVSGVALHRRVKDRNSRNHDLVQGDCTRLPFREEIFDNMVDVFTLEFIPNKRKYAEEVHRCLKYGGSLSAKVERRKTGTEPHSVDERSVARLLEDAGMKISKLQVSQSGRGLELEAVKTRGLSR